MDAIYDKLADYLDGLPASFPRTESGVELRILRKLFTPEEAGLALHLTLIEEEARVVAYRAHQPVEKVAEMLDEMEHKGLISGFHPTGQPALYAVSQFIVGIWEGQVDRLDREMVELAEEYQPYFFKTRLWNQQPQMRTIPVGESIAVTSEVLPYAQAEAIIRANTEFAVGDCICRKEMQIAGHACDRPVEMCLALGDTARDLVYAGKRREISMDEALALLKLANQAGLVLQPANSQAPMFICACCGDCCGILRYLKTQEKPAELVANAYIAQHDATTCSVCGTCLERCQMDAITLTDIAVQHHPERCIGCGLCVTTCPTGSFTMVLKPKDSLPDVPKNSLFTYLRLGQVRDRLFAAKMAGLMVKSKVDRRLAPH